MRAERRKSLVCLWKELNKSKILAVGRTTCREAKPRFGSEEILGFENTRRENGDSETPSLQKDPEVLIGRARESRPVSRQETHG